MKKSEIDKKDILDKGQNLVADNNIDTIQENSDQTASFQPEHTKTTLSFQADTESTGSVTVPDFGQRLRAERIRRGMNIGEVAHRLRLSEQQIEAIEAQDFSKLPAAVFLRGYVRNYANLLQLDDTTLLVEAIPQSRPADSIFTNKSPLQRFKAMEPVYQPGRGGRGGWLLYVVVILAAFVAYGLYHEEIPEQMASYMSDEEDQVIQSGSNSGNDQMAVDLALPLSPSTSMPPMAPSASAGVSLPSTAVILPSLPAPTPVADAARAADTGKKSLHFVFSKDSWVKIKDTNGQVILEKINSRGTEQTLEGEPPLYLVIGNAAGVSLTYNGRKIDLAPYTRGNDDVARFSLE
ncbi:helix-turn-helix domain-containing protein [Nitrosomonas sp. HPC101]|uniref:helix-turn-helix domain-containing protein n=1 Tax=Nitrosomonas sp. HPC101 TaxID=1658667 RepID=UPI001372132C|nr:helix-turn-helix domain-containing protein [Nitrosomonas sp. HPC101]MXS85611.1 helix-turn-helix domain-containing protein [Nitrosomonas sp. HPC101]